MRTAFTGVTTVVTMAAAVGVVSWTISAAGQTSAPRSPTPGAAVSKPNLNGIWQAVNAANWDLEAHSPRAGRPEDGAIGAAPPSLGVVEGGAIPYQPAVVAQRKANFAKRLTDDPELKCYLPGVPRATYLPYPFQIIQGTKDMMFVYEYANAQRVIHMGQVSPSPADTWMGQSRGRWEGNALVVDVTSFNDETWFDRSGNFHSDQLHVIERYSPQGSNTLHYEATIEDPKVFTRAWKISMPLYRRLEPNAQLLEFKCVEFAEELLYGHLRKKAPTEGSR
jgi:hypothetical protein